MSFWLQEHRDNQWVYRTAVNALEYRVTVHRAGHVFKIDGRMCNRGSEVIDGIDLVEPLRLDFDRPQDTWRHLYAQGGYKDAHYPPGPFTVQEWSLCREDFGMEIDPSGHSSNRELPLLISTSPARPGACGLFCALEWSGYWYISFTSEDADRHSRLCVGIPVDNMSLAPGEPLHLPPAHIGFFEGGPDGGTLALRRYLYHHICPAHQGKPMIPRVSYNSWDGWKNEISQDVLETEADTAARVGIETFVIDAGWFAGGFPAGVGNWDRVDREKFPDGLEGIADYVRSRGMDFGIWLEPERAGPDSDLYRAHPEWFVPHDFGPDFVIPGYVTNFALPEAQDYYIQWIDDFVSRLGVKWCKWDGNLAPRALWRTLDPSHKLQFNHYAGLYRVLDTLMERHPDLMLEMCAGGGRRIDLGMVRRAHTMWISDQTERAPYCRYMQARANRFLPGHLLNRAIAVGGPESDNRFDATGALSRMLGKLAVHGRMSSWSDQQVRTMAVWIEQFKSVRHLLVQDFYELLGQPTVAEDWDALEFVAWDQSEALLFVFAGSTPGCNSIRLKGLLQDEDYLVRRAPHNRPGKTIASEQLMHRGLDVALDAFEGTLFRLNSG
jgi:alpha-galactosidase